MKLRAALAVGYVLYASIAHGQDAPALDPKSLSAALAANPTGA